MKNDMVIIDADGHAVDAEPVYREQLPERYRKRNFIHPSDGFDRNQNDTISMSRGSLVVHLTRANARGTESSQTRHWREVDSNHQFLQARDAFDASAPVCAPMDAPPRTGENEVIAGAVASPFIFSVSIS